MKKEYGNALQWRHYGRNSVSNHQPHHCFLKGLIRRRSKKTWKLRVTGLCAGNSPGTGEFPAQMASNAENVSIWWRHHVNGLFAWMLGTRILTGVLPENVIKVISIVCPAISLKLSCLKLTYWERMTHTCTENWVVIGSGGGLSLVRCEAIIWNNAD